MRVLRFFLLLIFSQFYFLCSAQKNDLNFEHIGIEQGLSQSVITCILKDSRGFMWFGTQDGLNRFDGYSFKVFKNNPETKIDLLDNNINCLAEDNKGNLWIGTKGGNLIKYIREKDVFHPVKILVDSIEIDAKSILCLLFDGNTLWIGTEGPGLIQFDILSQQAKRYQSDFNSVAGTAIEKINNLYQSRHILWVGTNKGLFRLNVENRTTRYYSHDENDPASLSHDIVLSITEDVAGNLWIATWGGGLNCLNKGSNKFTHWLPNAKRKSIPTDYINTVLIDHHNNLWLATWNGLSKYNPEQNEFYTWQNDPLISTSIGNNNISTIYEDNTGVFWVGTWGLGIYKFYNEKPKFTHYYKNPRNKNSLSNNTVWSFFEDEDGILWIGTDEGLNKFDRVKNTFKVYKHNSHNRYSISENYVYCIYKDSRKNMWVGTWSGGLNKFDPKTEKFTHFEPDDNKPNSITSLIINAIVEDDSANLWLATANGLNKYNLISNKFEDISYLGNKALRKTGILSLYIGSNKGLWMGADGQGIYYIDFNQNKVEHFVHNPSDPASLSNNVVYSFFEDQAGRIWVGTDAGINIYYPQSFKFIQVDEKDGLPNNVVYGILGGNHNDIWLSTNNGLSHISYGLGNNAISNIRNFDVSDNLQSREFNLGAYFKSPSGEMFFGGINGFNSFFPDSITIVQSLPTLTFTDLKVFNKSVGVKSTDTGPRLEYPIEESHSIALSYQQKILSFEFSALHYVNPAKNKYAYMLKGFETEWKYTPSSRRFITYTNLNPGNYTLLIKASNNDGVWQKPRQLNIYIKPPFWKTIWFYSIVVLIIFLFIRIYIKIRERNLKLQNIKLEKKVKLRTKEISRQKKEITDSIIYSKHIQNAILPDVQTISNILPESFVFYLPREIIGGDFYWVNQQDDKIFVAVADCTGHGVPGALMSMLGITFLSEIIITQKQHNPAEILSLLRENIIKSLHQSHDEKSSRDGMDISLCVIHKAEKIMHYAGANQHITICNNGNVKEYKADKIPVRFHHTANLPYTLHEIKLHENDHIYMYSDGFSDQFGGPNGHKFLKNNFTKMLAEASNHPIKKQQPIITKVFFNWKGNQIQVDDVLVLGFKMIF